MDERDFYAMNNLKKVKKRLIFKDLKSLNITLTGEEIVRYGCQMQIIKDVDFDGNVEFLLDPEEQFRAIFETKNS